MATAMHDLLLVIKQVIDGWFERGCFCVVLTLSAAPILRQFQV